ncbi:hypothetical protein O181_058703 [Austropuccinia psidii MF-1]|uniref:Integrase catalytic domain-containing protein n=1 Tax=Austropuccinia psidii MF-1 TaxID=1389203 RepID=A0A9Q3EDI8_9BASI|nr:hypothetical protein [Austropuccinia psidii MF-1]
MIYIQQPKSPWKVVHIDWVTALPPIGDIAYDACLVIVGRYRKTPILLPFHNDNTAMDTAPILWNRVILHAPLLKNMISDRDPKFTSGLWNKLNRFLGTKLLFFKEYFPEAYYIESDSNIQGHDKDILCLLIRIQRFRWLYP